LDAQKTLSKSRKEWYYGQLIFPNTKTLILDNVEINGFYYPVGVSPFTINAKSIENLQYKLLADKLLIENC